MKKRYLIVGAFVILLVIAAISGALTSKDTESGENEGVENVNDGEDVNDTENNSPEQVESDPEVVEEYLAAFHGLQEDLQNEFDSRIDSNDVGGWGPYFSEFEEKVNEKRDAIKEDSNVSGSDKVDLGQIYSNLLMLGLSYGKEISGDDESEKIDAYQEEIENSLENLK